MFFDSALLALGFTGVVNTLTQVFSYSIGSSYAQQTVGHLGTGAWGVYTNDQAHTKELAMAVEGTEPPEMHGEGKYDHYHDSSHTFHIWYGGVVHY